MEDEEREKQKETALKGREAKEVQRNYLTKGKSSIYTGERIGPQILR